MRCLASWTLPSCRIVEIGDPDRRARGAGDDRVRQRDTAWRRRRIGRGWRNWRPTLQFDDPINIQFTSGTTGAPKGATLTHHDILNNGFFLGEAMELHRAGQAVHPGAALSLLRHGHRQPGLHHTWRGDGAVRARASIRSTTLQTVARSAALGLHGVPTMFIAELDHPEFRSFDLSSLRTGIMAGAPCPIESDAPLHPRHAPERDDHRLRHDRDQSGQHADGHGRSVERRVARWGACSRMSR